MLKDAEGEGAFVIAANLDIRGFSDWSQEVESVQAALYLAKLYSVLIDRWFSDDWFFKPTGDGLLLVKQFKAPELELVATTALSSSIEIVGEFGSLCTQDAMLNFSLPQEVGIGLAQGAASRLVSQGKTLDYSGAVLNLASRLMDLARPRGIVYDGGLAAGLLPAAITDKFAGAEVYLRGVAPKTPIPVQYLIGETEIPSPNLSPIGEIDWAQPVVKHTTVRELEANAATVHQLKLDSRPTNPDDIQCKAYMPTVDKRGRKMASGTQTAFDVPTWEYIEDADGPHVVFTFADLAKDLRARGAKGPWPIEVRVTYPQ